MTWRTSRGPAAPPRRTVRRASRALGAVLAAGLVASACGSSPHLPAPTLLIRSATAAATRAGSMHFLQVTTVGNAVATLTGDLGDGDEQETLVQKAGTLQVRLVDHTVYVNAGGDASVVAQLFGLNKFDSQSLAREWVSVSPSDAPYDKLVRSLDLSTQLAEFTPVRPNLATQGSVEVHGRSVLGVTGTASKATAGVAEGTTTLYVAPQRPYLPVGGAVMLTQGSEQESRLVSFTDWGVPVVVSAPSSSVPIGPILAPLSSQGQQG